MRAPAASSRWVWPPSSGVIDEAPGAYKDIDDVIRAQEDLVEVVARLRQVVCVKG
jgi:tRNA-splicing ligase RtcB